MKTDAELSASQLRSRYEVVNREHNWSADFGGPGGVGNGIGNGSELQHLGWGPDATVKWNGAEPPLLRARDGAMSSDSIDPSGKNKGGRRGSSGGLRLSRLSDCCDTSEPATPPIGTSLETSFFPPHSQYHGSSSTYSDSVSGGSSPNGSVHGLPLSSSIHGGFVGGPSSGFAPNSFDGGLNSLSGLSSTSSSTHGIGGGGGKSEFTAEVAQAAGVNLEGYVARSVRFTLARERRQRRKKWLKWAGGIGACVALMIVVAIVFESESSMSGSSSSSHSSSGHQSGSTVGRGHFFLNHGGRLLLSIKSLFSRPAVAVVEDPFAERPSAGAALAHPEAQAPPPIHHTSARAAMAAAGSTRGVPLIPSPLQVSEEMEDSAAWLGGWRRPCGQTWCVGDRVRLNAKALLEDSESPWAAPDVHSSGNSNSSSSSSGSGSKSMGGIGGGSGGLDAGAVGSPTTCTARVLLVQEDSSGNGARGAASGAGLKEEKEEEEEAADSRGSKPTTKRLPRMVLVLPDGWAGQAAFWLHEHDHALLSAKRGPSHGTASAAAAAAAAYTAQPLGQAGNTHDLDAQPCPYSFATLGDGGWDAVSSGGGAACSVAMRDYCELSAPEPPPTWALPSNSPRSAAAGGAPGSGVGVGGSRLAPQKQKSSSSGGGPPQQVPNHKRRASSCTAATHSHGLDGSAAAAIAASRRSNGGGGALSSQGGGLRGGSRDVDNSASGSGSKSASNSWGSNWKGVDRRVLGTPPAAWLAAQQDAHTLNAQCPPPSVLAWPPDRWSFPDCSRGMRAKLTSLLLQTDDPLPSGGGDGGGGSASSSPSSSSSGAAAQRLWWVAQTELAEEGACPRPELALWPPDAQTHPRCNNCVVDACAGSATRAEARASAQAAAAERMQPPPLSTDALSGSNLLGKTSHAWAAANPSAAAATTPPLVGAAGAGSNLTASSGVGERVRTATKWQPVSSGSTASSTGSDAGSSSGSASLDPEEASVAVSCGNRAQLEAAWQVLGPAGKVGDTAAPEVVAAAAAPVARHRRVLRDFAAAQEYCAAPASARGGGGGNRPLLPPNPLAASPPGNSGSDSSSGGGGAESLWAAGGLLDGACPASHILRWLPPPELAFPDCALALGHHCAAFATEDQGLASRHARHAPLTAADCAAGKWLSSNDVALAQRAQVAASEEGLCPAGSAASVRSGVSGIMWATHERSPHRSALSSRVCELPLI